MGLCGGYFSFTSDPQMNGIHSTTDLYSSDIIIYTKSNYNLNDILIFGQFTPLYLLLVFEGELSKELVILNNNFVKHSNKPADMMLSMRS